MVTSASVVDVVLRRRDGSVVVGFYQHPTLAHRMASRWVDDEPVELFLGEDDITDALDVSADGAHIVGNWYTHAFLYDDVAGMRDLGILGGLGSDERSVGSAVSDDGRRVANGLIPILDHCIPVAGERFKSTQIHTNLH